MPCEADGLSELLGIVDRLQAKLVEGLRSFDASAGWDAVGATSLTSWLVDRGVPRRDAARTATLARRLEELPVTARAWSSGALTGGQVDAIVTTLDTDTVAGFAESETELVPLLVELPAADVRAVVRHWKACAAADGALPAASRARSLYLSQVGDGFVGNLTLDAEGGEVVATAVRLAMTDDDLAGGEPLHTLSERRADALVDVCRWFLDHRGGRPGGRHRPHVNVVIDLDRLVDGAGGRVVDGPLLDAATMRRLLCDAGVHRVVTDGGSSILDYGRTTRTIPPPLWNALVVRDEHCRFPGCDRPSGWCEAHHLVPWTEGGATAPDNLALLCSRHHHRLHQPGWHAKLRPDATLEVTDPSGGVRSTVPPRVAATSFW